LLEDGALYDRYVALSADPDVRSDAAKAALWAGVVAEVEERSRIRLGEYLRHSPPPALAGSPASRLLLLLRGAIQYATSSTDDAEQRRRWQQASPIVRACLLAGGYLHDSALRDCPLGDVGWMGDDMIQSLLPRAGRENREALLTEVIRRGGAAWERALSKELDRVSQLDPIPSQIAGRLEILTALRRVQGRPDPLRVQLEGPRKLACTLPRLPDLIVSLTANAADGPVRIREGDNRSGRWRVEVTDVAGSVISPRNGPEAPGGLAAFRTLQPGGSLTTVLRMRQFVSALAPGRYSVRILYHDWIQIDRGPAPQGIVFFSSAPIELSVMPLEIDPTQVRPTLVHRLVERIAGAQTLKVVAGTYGPWAYDLVGPLSPQGELLSMGYAAIPPLVDELADPRLGPGPRAVVLSLLFSLTGENDPRDRSDLRVLGSFDRLDGPWTALGEGICDSPSGHEHIEGERIAEADQREFSRCWDRWTKLALREIG
jgi:hypothetical protein